MWDFNPRQMKILKWVGFPVFYLFCLLLFAYLTFPFERLKYRVIAEFNAAQAEGSGMRLEIDDVSWYWLTGIEAQGVRLVSPAPPPGPDGTAGRPQVFTIDDVNVHYSLWAWLVGDSHVSFAMEAGGGSAEGYVSDEDGVRTVSLQFDQMGISGMPFLASAVGLPMTGALSGTVELHLPERKLSKGDGSIELGISDLSLGDGKTKIRDTIALPRLNAGKLELVAKAKEGNLKIEKLTAQGPDLELHSDGRIRLRDPLGTSRTDLNLSFKFTDRYKTKNDMTKGLFGEPGSTVPGAFDLDGKNKQAKQPDGFYAWRVTGAFKSLSMRPAARASSKSRARTRASQTRKARPASRRTRKPRTPKP